MSKVLIDLQYLPSVAYTALLQNVDEVIIESHEHFIKQSFRNRALIHDANKVLPLSIPVKHSGLKIPIREVEIDYSQKWMNLHWRAIQSSYGKAPFFDYYVDYFKAEIYSEEPLLFILNKNLLTLCLKLLGSDLSLKFTEAYNKVASDGIMDFRSRITPKANLNDLSWFHAKPYYQLFGKDFVPNLSVLDLLFCTGPDASYISKESFQI